MAGRGLIFAHAGVVAAALLLDRLVGDPGALPHPVVVIGWVIARLESVWNRVSYAPARRRVLGGLMACLVVLVAALSAWLVLVLLARVSPILAVLGNVWLVSTTIAWKGLRGAGRQVAEALVRDGIAAARVEVGKVVGRDTDNLSEREVVRATVETLAENTVDGIIAPVLYGLIGLAPLALAYRAVNTLDSMVGYKNERYREFGFFSARLDDVANWLPARLTGGLMLVALFLLKMRVGAGFRTLLRDAGKHPSPNGGIPESIVAGGLGVRLGGYNSYHGVTSLRAYMGDETRPLGANDIWHTIRIVDAVSVLAFVMMALVMLVLGMLAVARSGW